MKTLKVLASLSAAAALAACSAHAKPHHGHQHGHHHHHGHHAHNHGKQADAYQPSQKLYTCQNGFVVQADYTSPDDAALTYGLLNDISNQTKLTNVPSGSGSLYASADRNTEWHTKGNTGVLTFTDPYGNKTTTSCKVETR